MKKTLSILFIFIFMLQALPVKHWVYGAGANNVSIGMADDMDNGGKDNTQKDLGKDSKENIIPEKYIYNKQIAYKFTGTLLIPSEHAIILHHADIKTPPPDIKA